MPKWLTAVIGAAEIAVGAALVATGVGGPAGVALISGGAGTLLSGIGTLLQKGPLQGTSTASLNPIAPWEIVYGRAAIGGTLIYDNEWGDNNKYRDMVIVLADHSCRDVYGLMFDRQRIQIDTAAVPSGVPASTFPAINGGTSFTPVQQTVNISTIARYKNVVTVTLSANIPLLLAGDYIVIQNVTGDATLNGKFPVYQILSQTFGGPGSITFTYLNGGAQVSYSSQGQTKTTWPDYGRKVYMEVLTGKQTLGQTFVGMTSGTPSDGDTGSLIGPSSNPWTSYCSCVGKTVVFLRLHYNDTYFANGLPQISFLVHGKDNIADPRFSPTSYGYSENAALCIADMMCDPTWGYKCVLGTDPASSPGKTVEANQLIAAANICDEPVQTATPIASPPATEARYSLNGHFPLTMKRGEILQNMLTACGGRVTYDNGSFKIWPAAWYPTLIVNAPGYSGQGIVTQNASKVVGGDQTNFPMLISGTYSYLKTVANGGLVTSASGYDITFTNDQQATSLMQWEVEYYDPTTGKIIAWVNVPHLSADHDTVFYLNYGNASITTFQGGAASAVWDSGYQAVLHLGNGSSLSAADSTSNANNGTITNATAGAGEIDGAASFNGTSAKVVIPSTVYSKTAGSLELWVNVAAGAGSGTYYSTGGYGGSGSQYGPGVYAYGLGIKALGWRFGAINNQPAILYPAGGWVSVAMTWDSAGNVYLYWDGAQIDSAVYSDPGTLPAQVDIGDFNSGGTPGNWWPGLVDEFRISNTVRSAGWIGTRYNNESSPSTFYSISALGNMAVNSISPWGPIRWRPTAQIRELFNGVKGTYINPANSWQSSDFPPYAQDNLHGYDVSPLVTTYGGDVNLIYDGGDRRWLDIQLPFTISAATAQRLAKIELLRRRNSAGNPVGTGTIALSMAGYQQTALDIVTITFAFFSWTNKQLEILVHRFAMEPGENGAVNLGTVLEVQESYPAIYDWSVAEELSPAGYQQSGIPGANTGASAPANVIASIGPGVSINEAGGVGQCTILVTWTAPADGYVTSGGRIEAQYQLATSPPGPWIALPSVAPSVTQITITGVQSGQSYTVQIRSVNAAGVPSAWVTAVTTASPPLSIITVTGALSQLYVINGT